MKKRKNILWIGILSFCLLFVMEIATDIWFGSNYPGYNWKTQSLSYLGQTGSPVEKWVSIWGVLFTILLTLFAYSFYQLNKSNKWAKIAACMLIIYGLGEGMGSGLFPIDAPDTITTMNGRLHNVFGGIGDTALVLLPFVFMLMFPKIENHRLHIYLWSVVGFGLLMASFFLIAKYFHPNNFILSYKGVWQRVYLFNYYVMLGVINWKMVQQIKLK